MLTVVFRSDKKSKTSLEVLQDNLQELEEYFWFNKLDLNANRTEFITFSLENDKRLNDVETATLDSTIVRKSDHCKYLGDPNDKHLGFQTQVEKMQKVWQSV